MNLFELLNQGSFQLKLRVGRDLITTNCLVKDNKIQLSFPYHADLLNEVKSRFENREWLGAPKYPDGPKVWAVPITYRNLFQLQTLLPDCKPYSRFSERHDLRPLIREYWSKRFKPKGTDIYSHQVEMVNWMLNVGWFIVAGEMGTGKTLATILAMEMSGVTEWIWVGPKTPLVAVKNDFLKWRSTIQPQFYTFDGLKDIIKHWPAGKLAPRGLVIDESSRIKTPASQRSVCVKHLADSMRKDHGEHCFIFELSGTPSPKTPTDWWHQCEVAAPGFIREANIHLFRQRLGIFVDRETVAGAGKYQHLMAWRDDEKRCDFCGQYADHPNHQSSMTHVTGRTHQLHQHVKSVNEVAKLATRLKGLVGVWLKEDCLDLPPKRFEIIHVKPTRSLMNALKIILDTSKSAIDALIRARCLSDGFQYKEKQVGIEGCPLCHGKKEILEWFDQDGGILTNEEVAEKQRFVYESDDNGVFHVVRKVAIDPIQKTTECPKCAGEGTIPILERELAEVECGKDQVLLDMLDRSDEPGRLNVYAGFTGSLDRIKRLVSKEGWATLRVDGRGWEGRTYDNKVISTDPQNLLRLYQEGQDEYPKMVFIGQPGAAGMGLTLTASPITFFFSNDFNAESRIQAMDRGHRIGMDKERGGWIIDVVHLPTDQKVLDNLNKKQELQRLSMIGLKEGLNFDGNE